MPKIKSIKKGPSTSVKIMRGWRMISVTSLPQNADVRISERKRLGMDYLGLDEFDKDIFKGWCIFFNALDLQILCPGPIHQLGDGSACFLHRNTDAGRSSAKNVPTH